MIDGYSVNGRRLKMPMMEELSETQSFYCLYQLLVVIIQDWSWIKSNENHSRTVAVLHAASRGICPGSARHFFWLQAQYFFISLKKQIKFKKKERGKRKKETESFRLSESSSGQFLQLPPSPPPPSSSPLCLLFPPSPTPSISSSPRRRRRLLFHNPIAAAGKVS